jgi:hypothetical protein
VPTVEDRVSGTVAGWAGIPETFALEAQLSHLWLTGTGGATVPFHPQAVSLLIARLQREFGPNNPDPRNLSFLIPGRFAPPGQIDTVADLVNTVTG